MKLFTKSREQNVELGIMERMAYMSGNVGIAFINTIIASFLLFLYRCPVFECRDFGNDYTCIKVIRWDNGYYNGADC